MGHRELSSNRGLFLLSADPGCVHSEPIVWGTRNRDRLRQAIVDKRARSSPGNGVPDCEVYGYVVCPISSRNRCTSRSGGSGEASVHPDEVVAAGVWSLAGHRPCLHRE